MGSYLYVCDEYDGMTSTVLYLSGRDLNDLVSREEVIEAVRSGYRYRGTGDPATAPARVGVEDGSITSYTAVFPEWNIKGGYTYSVGEDTWYVTPLFRADTGESLALLDGGVWNPHKTGGVAAVGTDELAVPDASSIGVVGSADIARHTLASVAAVRDIETVKVYSTTEANRTAFATETSDELGIDARAVPSSAEAVADVDVLVTATDASSPVIESEHVSPGTHINAMGAAHPEREIDVDTYRKVDKYVPDIRTRVFGHAVQERQRAARGFLEAFDRNAVSESTIHGELGEVVAGKVPGRTDEEEVTLVDSIGTAIETVSTAYMLYEKAVERGIGTEIEHFARREAANL